VHLKVGWSCAEIRDSQTLCTQPHCSVLTSTTMRKQVLRVPEVLAELSSNTLEGFVREQVAVLRDTGGGASTVPRLITDCLKHKVGPADMMSICIIKQLSRTHGRS
jgi:hypothetical protein